LDGDDLEYEAYGWRGIRKRCQAQWEEVHNKGLAAYKPIREKYPAQMSYRRAEVNEFSTVARRQGAADC
jgi:hypothetical protein